ncbi:hypothetical protein EON80_05025 [bacterium]|nr:MAG: hypothetical protein EON80_05025 [bacterium]
MELSNKDRRIMIALGGTLIAAIIVGRPILYAMNPQSVLENSDQLTLYSLRGYLNQEKLDEFHGWGIFGQKRVTDPQMKERLVTALYSSMDSSAPQYSCFSPSHGLRATRGGRTVDVVICFSCGKVDIYDRGQLRYHYLPISKEASPVFEKAIKAVGLRPG